MNISISRAVQNFVAKFDSRKSPVIYRGIDFESIDAITPDETIREQYPRKIIISTAARLYKWKGIEHSIEAIRNLPEEIQTKIIFLIIGDGEDYERLKKLSQNLPIAMLGNLPRERVIALLKASDIYIHSSMPGGGLSTSLLEAMYCHCAVIATKNEGADEVIIHQKNGFLLADTHPITTKDALIKIISNPVNRKQYAETAYNTINQKFSWKISERKYLDIFSKQS
jgi:glycosyltransferase involved in cell wall biosynthesis